MREITVAPRIPGLLVVEDAVWNIKTDGRIVNRVTGEFHPDQIREREAEKPRVWTAGGKCWTVNEAGQVCDADTGEVWIDSDAGREIGQVKEMRGTKWFAKYLGVSRQRACNLLNARRVTGAVRDAVTGAWDLSRLATTSVRAGKRGPRLGIFRQEKKGSLGVVKRGGFGAGHESVPRIVFASGLAPPPEQEWVL